MRYFGVTIFTLAAIFSIAGGYALFVVISALIRLGFEDWQFALLFVAFMAAGGLLLDKVHDRRE